jgi:mono/diheme cytochrome c family protein
MRAVLGVLAIVMLLALGAIAFAYSGLYNVGATAAHHPVVAWFLATTVNASVERRARGVEVPDLSDPALRRAGAGAFDAMCVVCHGGPGRERDALGQGLTPRPPDLGDAAARMSPAELFWVTRHGIRFTGMPAWGPTHSDELLWSMVAFMAELPNLDADGYRALLPTPDEADAQGHHHHHGEGHAH